MKLEDLVPTLELCKELKENGYSQFSNMYWLEADDKFFVAEAGYIDDVLTSSTPIVCAAPTASELGEQLPKEILGDEGMRFDLNIWTTHNWNIAYWWDEDSRRSSGMRIESFDHEKLVEAMAKMWLYLKKNELLEESQ